MMIPKGDVVVTRGEQDSFRSLDVKVLIKTFKLIQKMAIFIG